MDLAGGKAAAAAAAGLPSSPSADEEYWKSFLETTVHEEEVVEKLDCDYGMSPHQIGEILHRYNEQGALPPGILVIRSWPSKTCTQAILKELGVLPEHQVELEKGVFGPQIFIRYVTSMPAP